MLKKIIIPLFFAMATHTAFALDDMRLMRFPHINNNLIAFVYAGDIWTVDANGGDARRLTSHEGMELFPRISPDGKWIAFSGEYSGTRQIFVMPADGGTPRQLTYYNSVGVMPPRGGFDNVVLGWTPDSKQILIRANRTEFGSRNGKYFLVSIDGGLEKPLPIVNGGFADLSPDGQKIVFTPVDREFRTWKRYKGGRASDLWIYDLKKNTSEQITDFAGTDQIPTWYGNEIFFASDRDLKLNIWKYDISKKETTQVTFHKDFDVMWPSGSNGWLAYENGGYLYKLNLQTGVSEKVTVNIHFDNPNLLPYFKNVKSDIHSFSVSPGGKRALFDARGDIFSVPAENGKIENLTQSQGVREIFPSWSPDGKYISYISDATGEYEIYLLENKEKAQPRQLTKNSKAWKYQAEWSPDSRKLVYFDRTLKLWLVDVETGNHTEIDNAASSEIRSFAFSPDSKWITYAKEGTNGQAAIWVCDIASGKKQALTDTQFSNNSPVFSLCGNYIFFASNRDFNLAFSSFEFDYLYNRATRLYAMILKKDGPELFKYKEDTEPVKSDGKEEKEQPKNEESVNIQIDWEGINNRIVALPGNAGDYYIVAPVEGGLLYAEGGRLMRYNIKDEKAETILEQANAVTATPDGKTIMYRLGGDYYISKISPNLKPSGKLNLDRMEMKIEPQKEWKQIYADGWRIFRDYFYVDNLHGIDWNEVKQRYEALLPYVGHRADLDYVLSEVVSEANAGHAYVDWGDFPQVKRVEGGLPGAKLEADEKSKRYRIAQIYEGENWNAARRSPLTEQGVDINEGDYIIEINGKDVTTADNPYMYFENTAGTTVELKINSKATVDGARVVKIKPLTSELELLYFNWVKERREMVDKLSNGRIGYIHVPNTSYEGNRELFRGIYAYHDKEALIIDDRYNGGGFIPDRMADLLDRKTLVYWHRNGLDPNSAPNIAHDGPKAMLINGYSSSGGDAFPYFFKKMGLGKLIGTRTWGGLVGISGNARLVDGGYISVPRFGIFEKNGGWIIEGVGVYPDIEVTDRPEQLAKGVDPCIERAVQELLNELNENPVKKVETPAPPDRSKWIEVEIE